MTMNPRRQSTCESWASYWGEEMALVHRANASKLIELVRLAEEAARDDAQKYTRGFDIPIEGDDLDEWVKCYRAMYLQVYQNTVKSMNDERRLNGKIASDAISDVIRFLTELHESGRITNEEYQFQQSLLSKVQGAVKANAATMSRRHS